MSAVPQLGKESTFEALGQSWTTGRWTLAAWDELLALAKPHLPDPYDGLDKLLPALSPEQARVVILEAQKSKRRILSIGSPEVQEWLQTLEGQLSLFYVLLKQRHPDLTPERAMEIAAAVGAAKQAELVDAAAGQPPPTKNPEAPAA